MMNEKVKKALIELIKSILLAFAGFAAALLTTSCGSTTKATIRNVSTSATTEVTITTNNPSQITVDPSFKIDSLKTRKRR